MPPAGGFRYDAKAMTECFLGGVKQGKWKNTEEFTRAFQDANPEMKVVPGSIRNLAAEHGWKESAEEITAHNQLVESGDRLDKMTSRLYQDRDKITRLRRKCLDKMAWAMAHPEDEKSKAIAERAGKITQALHTMETDVERALQSPAVADGLPTYQVTFVDEQPQWAHEAGDWKEEKALRGAFVAPMAADGAGSSSEAQKGVGGSENPKDGAGAPVAAGDGAEESVQRGSVVHGSDVRVGKADRVGAAERNVG